MKIILKWAELQLLAKYYYFAPNNPTGELTSNSNIYNAEMEEGKPILPAVSIRRISAKEMMQRFEELKLDIPSIEKMFMDAPVIRRTVKINIFNDEEE